MNHQSSTGLLIQLQRDALSAGVTRLLQLLSLGSQTTYRKLLLDEIERTLAEVDRLCGLPPHPIPRRTRALLLAPNHIVSLVPEVRAYVEGVATGLGVSELEDLVVAMESAELVRRFRRYAQGCNRKHLTQMVAVLDVMTT